MSVTIKAGLDGSRFTAGLRALTAEGRNFRETFKKNLESGGGLFGSFDAALGKLAGGRFAAPIAAIGAGLAVVRGVAGALERHWENIAASTERARQNVEAMNATRDAVAGQARAGDSANAYEAIRARGLRSEAEQAAREGAELGDPTTFAGASRTAVALNNGERNFSAFVTMLRINAGRFGVPFFGKDFEAANQLYNERQQRAQETRHEADRAEQLRPYVELANRTEQRSGQAAVTAAQDRLDVAQGRKTAYEAAANAFLFASKQYEDLRGTLKNDDDPRVQSARAGVLNAFAAYDSELTQARRFRNDPTIAADSLTRLGGGGGVNVFGDGRGELLFEQKRMTQSMQQIVQIAQRIEAAFSRSAGGDVN